MTRVRTGQPRNKWLDYRQEQGIFLFSGACWPAVGPCSLDAGGSGLKQPGCEADNLTST